MIRSKRTKLEFSRLNSSYIIGDMKTLVESSIFKTVVHVIKEYAIFLIDPRGIIVTWNKGAESIKGYSQGEILGLNYSVLFTLEDQASGEPAQQLTQALEMGVFEKQGVRLRKDGSKFIARITLTPLMNAQNEHIGFIKVTRDASEEFKTRAKLEGDVDLRDEFLAIASHELRTPLTSLKLAASLYIRNTPNPHIEFATKVNRSVDQLTRLVGDMLDVSRIDRGNLHLEFLPHQLDFLLGQAVSEVSTIYTSEGKNPPLLDIKSAEYGGSFDYIRLEQVFANLLLNSLRHGEGKEVKVSLERIDGLAVILFIDSGPGIPTADIAKIFNRFDKGSRRTSSKGMGLGLYISKQIVEAHHGTISALANGRETIIEVKLPLLND